MKKGLQPRGKDRNNVLFFLFRLTLVIMTKTGKITKLGNFDDIIDDINDRKTPSSEDLV